MNTLTSNMIDVFTDSTKILIYFVIWDSDNFQSPGLQNSSSFCIPVLFFRFIML